MTDPHAEAERWAGPHDQGCNTRLGEADTMDSACDCSRRERVAGIEAALQKAHLGADRLADEVAVLVRRGVIDSRSPAADALLDFREPPSTPRADRLAELEAALREAREDENRLWLATVKGERNAHSDHRVKVVADALREARRQGRKVALEDAVMEIRHVKIFPYPITIQRAIDAIRALPLDEPAPEAKP